MNLHRNLNAKTGGKHGLFTCFSLTDFYGNLMPGFKTKLGPSKRQNDPKKILTECLLTQTAEFHTQPSSKTWRRKRLYFEFKTKFCSWTLLYNNVTAEFHVCLNDFQIKWAQFARQKNAFLFFLIIARIANLAWDLRSKFDSFWLIYWQS